MVVASIVVVVDVVVVGLPIAVWADLDQDHLSFGQADTVAVVCLAAAVVVAVVAYTSSLDADHKIVAHTYADQPLVVLGPDTSFARTGQSFP